MYDFYKNGIIHKKGKVILKDGTQHLVKFKCKSIASESSDHFMEFVKLDDLNIKIPKKEILTLEFQTGNLCDVLNIKSSILKIVLGGAYYLLVKRRNVFNVIKEIFYDRTFALIREELLGRGNFTLGNSGISGIVKMELILPEAALTILEQYTENINTRRHIISIEKKDTNLEIFVCLFSEFFWKITIPVNKNLSLEKIEEVFPLYKLRDFDISNLGSPTLNKENYTIVVAINKS
jgi:hypothetical protein